MILEELINHCLFLHLYNWDKYSANSEGCDKNKVDTTCKALTTWLVHSKQLLNHWMLAAIIMSFDLLNNTVKLSVNIIPTL